MAELERCILREMNKGKLHEKGWQRYGDSNPGLMAEKNQLLYLIWGRKSFKPIP